MTMTYGCGSQVRRGHSRWWGPVAIALLTLTASVPALAQSTSSDTGPRPLLFVPSFSTNQVSVFDARDHQLVTRIAIESHGACCVYVSPDQRSAYVVGGASPTVSVIDTRTLEVRQVIQIPGTIGDRGSPLPADGRTFWVDTLPEGNISAIDTATGAVTRTFNGVGLQFENSPDGRWLYVVDRDENSLASSLYVRSTDDGHVVGQMPLPHGPGIGIEVAPDGETIYLLGDADLPSGLLTVDRSWVDVVDVRDPAQPQLLRSIPAGPLVQAGETTPDGRQLWVPSNGDGAVLVIDTETNSVIRTIETGRQVCGVGFYGDIAYLVMENSGLDLPPSYLGAMTYGCNNVVPGALLAPPSGTRPRPVLDTAAEMVMYDRHTFTPLPLPSISLPSVAFYVTPVLVPVDD